MTISVGGAAPSRSTDPDAGKHLLEAADAALYRAKENGPQPGRDRPASAPADCRQRPVDPPGLRLASPDGPREAPEPPGRRSSGSARSRSRSRRRCRGSRAARTILR